MLILSRKLHERIVIDDDVVLTVNRLSRNRVVIGIEAPPEVRVVRGEVAAYDEQVKRIAPLRRVRSMMAPVPR